MNQPPHFEVTVRPDPPDASSTAFRTTAQALPEVLKMVIASPRQLDHLAFGAYGYEVPVIRLLAAKSRLQDAVSHCRAAWPDVIILDVSYPERSAFQEARKLMADGFTGQIVFIDDRLAIWRAYLALTIDGACYFTRRGRLRELCEYLISRAARRHVPQRRQSCTLPSSECLIIDAEALKRRDVHGVLKLSEKRIEVMRRLASGQTIQEVAEARGLSVKTIVNHKTNIMRSLGVNRMFDVTRIALETGLIGEI